jgi:hypothetical protein
MSTAWPVRLRGYPARIASPEDLARYPTNPSPSLAAVREDMLLLLRAPEVYALVRWRRKRRLLLPHRLFLLRAKERRGQRRAVLRVSLAADDIVGAS